MVARNKLTDTKIRALKTGTHSDGAGLCIRINNPNSKQWVYRFSYLKKPKAMGLGAYPDVSLQNARKLRDKWAAELIAGKNPIDIKKQEMIASEECADHKLLKSVALRAFEAKKASLKEKGQKGEWISQLKNHVLPKLGDKNVEELTQHDVYDVLYPIWISKAETAKKAINRLKITLEYAESMGLEVNVDIIRKAKTLLGSQPKSDIHMSSMPWREVPAFYSSLTNRNLTHLGLRFLILNVGCRTYPIRHMKLDQIDDGLWKIPAKTMKNSKPFTIPLSDESLRIVEELKQFERNGFLFPNYNGASVVSENIFSKYMREDLNLKVVPHGFRSSFRTWALDNGHDRDIAELCMSHKVYSDVEAAYINSEAMDKRRELMQKWSNFVCQTENCKI